MKIPETGRKVESVGSKGKSHFRIAASAKAFQILSSGVYSDKIQAVIRELGTNAADSHVMAGKPDVPFKVHLPNSMEPFFSVEDWGIGLSHEEATTMYTTYFESDKTDSNDVTGCLGLGSKSPFAYTDSFTAVCIKDGKKNVYSLYIDEDGTPTIDHQYSGETNESNGVKITLPVKKEDFQSFISKARDVYRWFDVQPTIVGCSDFAYPGDEEILLSSDDGTWSLVSESFGFQSVVVMANVAYPIFANDIRQKRDINEAEKSLINHGLIIRVPTGSCDISASRERLSLNKTTLDTISHVLKEASKKCIEQTQLEIDRCNNIWEARLRYKELTQRNIIGTFARQMNAKFTYQGKELKRRIPLVKTVTEKDKTGNDINRVVPLALAQAVTLKKIYRRKVGGYDYNLYVNDVQVIDPEPSIHIIYRDENKYKDKIKYFLNPDEDSKHDRSGDTVYLISESEDCNFDEFIEETGIDCIIRKLSDLPEPPKSIIECQKKQKTAKAVRLTGYDHNQKDAWEDAEINLDDGGIYVEVNRYLWSAGHLTDCGYKGPKDLVRLTKFLRSIGCISVNGLVGFRKTLVSKIQDDPNWVRLDEYIDSAYTDKIREVYKKIVDYRAALTLEINFKLWIPELVDEYPLVADSQFGELANMIRHLHINCDEAMSQLMCINSLKKYCVTSDSDSIIKKFNEIYAKTAKTYPMIDFRRYPGSKEKIVDYVRLIDEVGKSAGDNPNQSKTEAEAEAAAA